MIKNKTPTPNSGRLKSSAYSHQYTTRHHHTKIDFKDLAEHLKPRIPDMIQNLLPQGRFEKHEYVALNPTRSDRHLGSFRINTRSGQWSDFATNDRGGDFISLWAYVKGLTQLEAARDLQTLIGRVP